MLEYGNVVYGLYYGINNYTMVMKGVFTKSPNDNLDSCGYIVSNDVSIDIGKFTYVCSTKEELYNEINRRYNINKEHEMYHIDKLNKEINLRLSYIEVAKKQRDDAIDSLNSINDSEGKK